MSNNNFPEGFEPTTPTGLPNINKPTDGSLPDGFEPSAPPPVTSPTHSILDTIASANPITDLANTALKNPRARHLVNDIAFQEGGAALGTIALPGIGTVAGAGAGNAAAKVVNDVEDDPDLALRAANYIFNDPQHTQLIGDLMGKDPDKAATYVRNLGIPLLQRFTQGAIFQLIGMGLGTATKTSTQALDVGSKALANLPEGVARVPGTPFIGPPETGVTLNPDMVTSSKVAEVLDKTARRGILSGDKMRAFDVANRDALDSAQRKITSELSGKLSEHIPRTQLAEYITSTNEVGQKIQKAVQDHLYQQADDALGGQLVPVAEKAPSGIIDPSTGKEILSETGNTVYKRVGGITVPTAQIKDLSSLELTKAELINGIGNAEKLGGLLKKIQTLDSGVNFSDMHNLRSELLDLNRDATTNGAKRILTSLATRVSDVMEDTAGKLNPEGFTKWRQAQDFYREGVNTFKDDAVSKLLTNDYRMADSLGNAMYRNGNITQIQQLKKIATRVDNLVNNPKFSEQFKEVMEANPRLQGTLNKGELTYGAIMNRYKRGYLQEMFNAYMPKSVNPRLGTSVPNFQGIMGELQDPEALQTMKELFKPEEIVRLQKFAKVGALAMKHASESVTERIGMLSRMTGWATGPLAARLLTNPESADMLMNGISRLSENNPKSIKAGTELMLRAANAVLENKSENDTGE